MTRLKAHLSREDGMTVTEVLVAVAVVAIGLTALLAMMSTGAVSVAGGGYQSQATALARQQLETLRNQPFTVGPVNSSDTPAAGITRTWNIAQVGATPAPNRLARIVVTVSAGPSPGTVGRQNIVLETMRSE